ncbi:MAG: PilW family protein [Cellvibrionaceae bacterium]
MKFPFKQTGLTIIELMIAVALGVTLLAGVLQIFDANNQSGRLQTAFARVQESGRIATDMLARDIRNADYWGCAPDASGIISNLNPGAGNYLDSLLGGGLDGENDVVTEEVGGLDVIAGTDTLILRGGYSPDDVGLDNHQPHGTAIHLRAGSGAFVESCGIYVLTNCNGSGDIFQNTGASGASADNMGHNSGSCTPGNQSYGAAGNWGSGEVYGEDTSLLIPYETTYFLAAGVNGQPSLFKQINSNTPQELVPNVVDMQILYGEDSSGNGSVDNFDDASGVTMGRVAAVRIELTVQSQELMANGNPLRRTYTSTTNIRNRSL